MRDAQRWTVRRGFASAPLLVRPPLLAGCGSDGSDGTPDSPSTSVFTAMGEGPENDEPLWPLHPGFTSSLTRRSIDGMVHPPVVIQGRTLLPYDGPLPFVPVANPFNHQVGPEQPVAVAYFSNAEAGVLLHGYTRDALWPAPALFLPTKVRAGMSWTVSVAGKARFTFGIGGGEVRPTRFGRRRVWTLTIFDADIRIGLPDKILHGQQNEMTFIEGRGPEYALTVPLEEPPLPAPPRVPVRTIGDDKSIGTPLALSMVGIATPLRHGRGLLVKVNGLYAEPNSVSCRLYRPDSSPQIEVSDDCSGGLDATVVSDGYVHSFVPGYDPQLCRPGACQQIQQLAMYSGKDNRLYGFGYSGSTSGLVWGQYSDPGVGPQSYPHSKYDFDELQPRIEFGPVQRLFESHLTEGWTAWAKPLAAGLAYAPVGPAHVSYARIDEVQGTLSGAHFAGYSRPEISWKLTPAGHEAYRALPSGRVEQLRLTDQGVEVIPLADLDLPAGTYLGGAVVHEGKIVGVVVDHFYGNDQQFTDGGFDEGFPSLLFESHLVEADLPPTPGPAVPPALLGTFAEADAASASQFARVCVPPGAGSMGTTGFVVNGAPARAVALGGSGRCASVFYSRTEVIPLDPLPDTPVDLLAPIPGVGRVAVQPTRSPAWKGRTGAALADGGLVSGDDLLDEMGFLEGMRDQLTTLVIANSGLADRAGAGLWTTNRRDPSELILVGRKVQRFPGLGQPLEAVAGGGVLVKGGLLRPGAMAPTPLPVLPSDPNDFDRGGVILADGTACGFGAQVRQCVSPTGQMVTAHGPGPAGIPARWFAVGQSPYLLTTEQRGLFTSPTLVRFDRTLERPVVYGPGLLGFTEQENLSGEALRIAYTPEGDAMIVSHDFLYLVKESEVLRAPFEDRTSFGKFELLVTPRLISYGPDTITIERSALTFTRVEPDGGLGRCPAGQHPCGMSCVADVANDPALGCKYGCGAACPVPDHGTATCSPQGACGLACTPPFVLDSGVCVCTPGVCNGAPQACTSFVDSCGKTVTCNTCGVGFACDLMQQKCTCPVDPREPNDTPAQANLLPPLVVAVGPGSQLDTFDFALDTDLDADWTGYAVSERSPNHLKYIIQNKLLNGLGGTTQEMTVLFRCDAVGMPTIACALGVPTTVAGIPGCKSQPGQGVNKDVFFTVDCPGNDASGTYYVGLGSSMWQPRCGVALHVDSRLYLQ